MLPRVCMHHVLVLKVAFDTTKGIPNFFQNCGYESNIKILYIIELTIINFVMALSMKKLVFVKSNQTA